MKKFAYKVLQKNSKGDLISFNVNARDISSCEFSDTCLKYPTDNIVRPKVKGTRLFVFERASQALHLCNSLSGCELWEVQVDRLIQPKSSKITSVSISDLKKNKKLYWKNGHLIGDEYSCLLPEGTRLCSQLKLVRKIK